MTSPTASSDPSDLLRHGPFLRRLARSLVADDSRADDVVQEAWTAALASPPRQGGDLGGWLTVVTRNFAFRSRRTDARVRRREAAAARPEAVPDATSAVARAEELRNIAEAVLALDEPIRTVLVERFYEDRSEREIAARHGVTRWRVRAWLEEALAQVRASLDRSHQGNRAAWVVMIAPWARPPLVTGGAVAGGVAMGVKPALVMSGVALVLAVAIGFGAGWVARGPSASVAAPPAATPPVAEAAAAAMRPPRAGPAAASTSPPASAAPSQPAPAAAVDPEEFLAAIEAARSWKGAWDVANDRVARPGGALALAAILPRITDPEKRAQVLKSVAFKHPDTLAVLDAAMRGTDKARSFAVSYLREIAFADFDDLDSDYAGWIARMRGRPMKDVVADSFAEWVARASAAPPERIPAELVAVREQPRRAMQTWDIDPAAMPALADAARTAARWLTSPEVPEETKVAVLDWLPSLPGDHGPLRDAVRGLVEQTDAARREAAAAEDRAEGALAAARPAPLAWTPSPPAAPRDARREALSALERTKTDRATLEAVVLPIVRDWGDDEEAFETACRLLGAHGKPWAYDALATAVVETPSTMRWRTSAHALAKMGDPRAIPFLIGVIASDTTGNAAYDVGYFGLTELTGVGYLKTHDAAWWKAWWEANRARFGDAGSLPIPALDLRALRAR